MDPEYEGQDLSAVLDWAENLEGLRRRNNGEMMVGSYGGSYGGMYQVLLYAVDPKHRLRVLAPDITPHDLTYSLDPNGVVKSRSEEHTSELQSLMRISYAVFCLKKKNNKT